MHRISPSTNSSSSESCNISSMSFTAPFSKRLAWKVPTILLIETKEEEKRRGVKR